MPVHEGTICARMLKESPLKEQNNFKPQNIIFTIGIAQSFSNESVCIREKLIPKTLILAFKFPGRRHLE